MHFCLRNVQVTLTELQWNDLTSEKLCPQVNIYHLADRFFIFFFHFASNVCGSVDCLIFRISVQTEFLLDNWQCLFIPIDNQRRLGLKKKNRFNSAAKNPLIFRSDKIWLKLVTFPVYYFFFYLSVIFLKLFYLLNVLSSILSFCIDLLFVFALIFFNFRIKMEAFSQIL